MGSTTFRRNGATRTVPFGFSWTSFFLGFLPSAIRGHWPLVWLAISADCIALFVSGWVFKGEDALGSLLAARVFLGMVANSTYAEYLRGQGWSDKDEEFRFLPPINDGE